MELVNQYFRIPNKDQLHKILLVLKSLSNKYEKDIDYIFHKEVTATSILYMYSGRLLFINNCNPTDKFLINENLIPCSLEELLTYE